METVLIAFGTNLGDRDDSIRKMLDLVADTPGVRVTRCSSIYETAPVGGPEQGAYLNGVFLAACELTPEDLHKELQRIESVLGRTRAVRWGPRTMDLDILLFGDRIVHTPELTVPHPRMAERAFVLVPAAEVAPDMVVPGGGQTIRELCDALAKRMGAEAIGRDVRRRAPSPL